MIMRRSILRISSTLVPARSQPRKISVADARRFLGVGTYSFQSPRLRNGIPGLFVLAMATTMGYYMFDSKASKPEWQASQYADKVTMLKAAMDIRQSLGEDAVSMDDDDLESHGFSEYSTSNVNTRPVAVIKPSCTEDVSIIAKICNKYKVPMIPFGGGSSVEGHFSAPYSGFSIDLSQMDKIIAINEEDMDVVVQPGVNWVYLNEKIQPTGLFLPLDPSPTAHIGGMIATNCSGTNALRYGTMKDWVVNLTVVLADGSVVKTRRRPRKTSAGYNLNGLFTGSEGTLGIITEITLKLAILPSHFGVATTAFSTITDATKAASAMIRAGVPLAALELMDEVQMSVINKTGGAAGRKWLEQPTLFIKFSGSKNVVEDSLVATNSIAVAHGATNFTSTEDPETMTSLWSARKQALWAMLAIKPEGTQIWSTDVAVPISRLAEIVEKSKEDAAQLSLFASVLGHVGDGNFHQSVMYYPERQDQVEKVRQCVDIMIDRALEMDGTVSGEHGIGLGKKSCLEKELGSVTIDVMRRLKRSLDPNWLLNPGKILDF